MTLPWVAVHTGAVVVYDLEYTTWEGARARRWMAPGEFREVVEIAAVSLDAGRGFAETGIMTLLVKPRLNPQLSDYFVELTGIGQAELDEKGVSYQQARTQFASFVSQAVSAPGRRVWSYGEDNEILSENDRLWNLPPVVAAGHFADIRSALAKEGGFDPRLVDSSSLPQTLGLSVSGRAHRALDDARSVVAAVRALNARGRETG